MSLWRLAIESLIGGLIGGVCAYAVNRRERLRNRRHRKP